MLYVAYGSNIPSKQMKRRCPNAIFIGKGMLKNYELNFNYHADIKKCKDNSVPVVVWDITKDDELRLDYYEGYPSYYTKHNVEVILDNGKTVTGMVYEMTKENKINKEYYPNIDYFNIIVDGYIEYNLDKSFLKKAIDKVGEVNVNDSEKKYRY